MTRRRRLQYICIYIFLISRDRGTYFHTLLLPFFCFCDRGTNNAKYIPETLWPSVDGHVLNVLRARRVPPMTMQMGRTGARLPPKERRQRTALGRCGRVGAAWTEAKRANGASSRSAA